MNHFNTVFRTISHCRVAALEDHIELADRSESFGTESHHAGPCSEGHIHVNCSPVIAEAFAQVHRHAFSLLNARVHLWLCCQPSHCTAQQQVVICLSLRLRKRLTRLICLPQAVNFLMQLHPDGLLTAYTGSWPQSLSGVVCQQLLQRQLQVATVTYRALCWSLMLPTHLGYVFGRCSPPANQQVQAMNTHWPPVQTRHFRTHSPPCVHNKLG
jgi:hypothetical protein